ncbi:hypothetical protein ABW19_dt0202444 [Dactylella cylindrospora]|nr:hypothetical protein ABW19_dt0202444 [Dactylella cylindrospora]
MGNAQPNAVRKAYTGQSHLLNPGQPQSNATRESMLANLKARRLAMTSVPPHTSATTPASAYGPPSALLSSMQALNKEVNLTGIADTPVPQQVRDGPGVIPENRFPISLIKSNPPNALPTETTGFLTYPPKLSQESSNIIPHHRPTSINYSRLAPGGQHHGLPNLAGVHGYLPLPPQGQIPLSFENETSTKPKIPQRSLSASYKSQPGPPTVSKAFASDPGSAESAQRNLDPSVPGLLTPSSTKDSFDSLVNALHSIHTDSLQGGQSPAPRLPTRDMKALDRALLARNRFVAQNKKPTVSGAISSQEEKSQIYLKLESQNSGIPTITEPEIWGPGATAAKASPAKANSDNFLPDPLSARPELCRSNSGTILERPASVRGARPPTIVSQPRPGPNIGSFSSSSSRGSSTPARQPAPGMKPSLTTASDAPGTESEKLGQSGRDTDSSPTPSETGIKPIREPFFTVQKRNEYWNTDGIDTTSLNSQHGLHNGKPEFSSFPERIDNYDDAYEAMMLGGKVDSFMRNPNEITQTFSGATIQNPNPAQKEKRSIWDNTHNTADDLMLNVMSINRSKNLKITAWLDYTAEKKLQKFSASTGALGVKRSVEQEAASIRGRTAKRAKTTDEAEMKKENKKCGVSDVFNINSGKLVGEL